MNNQFKEICLKAEEGMTYEVTQQGDSLLIRAISLAAATGENDEYSYDNPIIPEGYTHIEGEWNNGFIIQDERGNQFVWIPVGNLPANGTLNGKKFDSRFGRRNYRNNEFSKGEYHEDMDDSLKEQVESVKKYGGFYISRYAVSKGDDELYYSIKGKMPLTSINFGDSLTAAQKLGQGIVTSHMVFGAEYDSVLAWFMETGKTENDISKDSTAFGNYWNCANSPQKVVETGSREEWKVNGIYDLAGNVWEWTQEANDSSRRTLRGGSYSYDGYNCPVAYRSYLSTYNYSGYVGFRVSLYIK